LTLIKYITKCDEFIEGSGTAIFDKTGVFLKVWVYYIKGKKRKRCWIQIPV